MPQDPLHVLFVEPRFPGRLGAVADWLVRRRGYRAWFYCQAADPQDRWPASAMPGRGLEVQLFGVGGVAREPAVAWPLALERGLCYAYGCWEVLELRRPRPIDLIVGRSDAVGSTLFAPIYAPAAPVVNFFDYFRHPRRHDLADEAGPDTPDAYIRWRRSASAVELLDLEHCDLAWTATRWQRSLFPRAYRDDLAVVFDGVDTRRLGPPAARPRTVLGRSLPPETKLVTFVARSLDRIRGFDRFLDLADRLIRARADVVCIAAGDPVVRRPLDVAFHGKDYRASRLAQRPVADPERLWFTGPVGPDEVAEVLAASDLHVAPGRAYPAARSMVEAMARGRVVLAADTPPAREFLRDGVDGLLAPGDDADALFDRAMAVLDDPAAFSPLGDAAAELVRAEYARDVTLPRLAERFDRLVAARLGPRPGAGEGPRP